LDHAATTPLDPLVYEAMKPYFIEKFGNPSSIYQTGQIAKNAIERSRLEVAKILGAKSKEITFTSGGTESDNLAILGVARASKHKGKHIITSNIEHHAVLHTCEALEKEGYEVTYIPVEKNGIIDPDKVKKAMRDDTILVSIMYANNEIGTIQPIAKIGRACKKKAIPFHTDACQATGALMLDVDRLHLDLMTINGSKMYGPKGVGVLYIRKGTPLLPIMYGGEQEKKIRPGTENVPTIIGFTKALEIAEKKREKESKRLTKLRDYMINEILENIPRTQLNGDKANRLPNNVNVSILDIEGESILLRLDMKGISASSGSACTSGSLDPSHVILAMGKPHFVAHGSIRFTLGRSTKKKDIDYTVDELAKTAETLRAISPITT